MSRGPAPKDPELRRRKNKASTAAELVLPDSAEVQKLKIPPLTKELLGFKMAIKPQVQAWWKDAWQSPMAPRWLKTDIHVLYVCAQIRQQVQLAIQDGKPFASLAAELRQQESRLGLDVMSRRRLDWRIEGPREPDAPQAPQQIPEQPAAEFDPRKVLRALP